MTTDSNPTNPVVEDCTKPSEGIDYSTAENTPQVLCALAAALCAICTGSVVGWSAPVQPQLELSNASLIANTSESELYISQDEMSWVASLLNVGTLVGSMVAGLIMDSIGRKNAQLLVLPPFVLGYLLLFFARNPAMLYSGRIICGLAAGIEAVATPAYIGEISTPSIRGILGSLFMLFTCVGFLFVCSVGLGLAWRWLTLTTGMIPVIAFIAMLFVPESPTYLIRKGHVEAARQALKRLRGSNFPADDELKALQDSLQSSDVEKARFADLLKPGNVKPLAVALGLMASQQMCGCHAAIFYTVAIFRSAGSSLDPRIATIIIAAVEVGATLFSTVVIDRLGRRVLLLVSNTLMALAIGALGAVFYIKDSVDEKLASQLGWLPLVSLVVFIAAFSLGVGPIPWLMLNEILPANIRGIGASIATCLYFILSFVVAKVFVNLQRLLTSAGTFWLFGSFSLLSAVFVWFSVPETKGKSYTEIATFFSKKENQTN